MRKLPLFIKLLPFMLLFLMGFPSAAAQTELDSVLSTVQSIFQAIGIVEPPFISLMRIAFMALVAFLLFEVLALVGLHRGTAGTIAGIISIASIIFIPSSVMVGIGATYSTLIALLLTLAPIAGLLFVVYGLIPGHSVTWRLARVLLIAITLSLEVSIYAWLF